MGHSGWPDIFALQPTRGEVLVAELKTEHGRLEPLQSVWLQAFDACGLPSRVVRPADYDALVDELVGDRMLMRRTRR